MNFTPALGEHRYRWLLLILAFSLVAQSISFDDVPWKISREIIVTLNMLAVFYVVFEEVGHRRVALLLVLSGIVASWAQGVAGERLRLPIELVHNALIVLLFSMAVAVILRHLFERRRVTIDTIYGTICGYLMLGVVWANLYAAVGLAVPDSFVVASPLQQQMNDWDGRHAVFQYFSLATLTSVGYGDVTAARGPVTALSVLEAVAGQFYIAVVVAQLVGARLAQAFSDEG